MQLRRKTGSYIKKSAPKKKVAAVSGRGAYVQRARAAANRVAPRAATGRGKYHLADDYGSRAGKAIGSFFGPFGELGGLLGEGIQGIGRALGFGDYKVEHNALLDAGMWGNSPPAMVNVPRNLTHIVQHREYIADVYTAANGVFNLQSFHINPGLVSTFPWLSSIAQGFEQYVVEGMIFEFKSTSADALNSTNTALGTVMLATEYDASRPNFVNQQQMLNHEFASANRQLASVFHAIECKKSLTPIGELWVRTGAVPAGDDERLYDYANFQIATVGSQSSSAVNIGQLWVTYQIRFLKPQLLSGLGLQLLTDHFQSASSVSTSAYFGSPAPAAQSGSNLGCTLDTANIYFPPNLSEGTYLIAVNWIGTAASVSIPGHTFTNVQYVGIWQPSGMTTANNSATTSGILMLNFVVKLTGQNAVITFSSGTLPTSITSMDLVITQINGNIIS